MTQLMKALDLRDAADELKASADSQVKMVTRLVHEGLIEASFEPDLLICAERYRTQASLLILNSVNPD